MGSVVAGTGGLRLLVTVTFNANQLRSHLLPLIARDDIESITLVSDVAPPALPKLRAVVPSRRMRRLLGRAGAKLALCRRLAAEAGYDWVMGFNFVPHGFNAQLVARGAGTRSMYHMIGGATEWEGGGWASMNSVLGRLPRPSRRVERFLLAAMRRATLVATMGPTERARLLAIGFPADRVVVIPPSTDVARFSPGSGIRKEFDLISVGRLVPLKRNDDMLKAVARLSDRHPGISIAFAGEGPARPALERHAHELGIAERVTFLGHVDAVEGVYRSSRVFVSSSDTEGLPIAMLDAMATGLPVVATDVGEVGTVIRDGENGYLYTSGDVDELSGRLDLLLSAPDLERSLGSTARESVIERFSIEAVAEIYGPLLTGPLAPAGSARA